MFIKPLIQFAGAVARFLAWGQLVPDPGKFSESQSGEENSFGLLGGPGACSPGKFLK